MGEIHGFDVIVVCVLIVVLVEKGCLFLGQTTLDAPPGTLVLFHGVHGYLVGFAFGGFDGAEGFEEGSLSAAGVGCPWGKGDFEGLVLDWNAGGGWWACDFERLWRVVVRGDGYGLKMGAWGYICRLWLGTIVPGSYGYRPGCKVDAGCSDDGHVGKGIDWCEWFAVN